MKKKGTVIIAILTAVTLLFTQVSALAAKSLTAPEIMDSSKMGQDGMLTGFRMDSGTWSYWPKSEEYGQYHEHAKWYMNLTGVNGYGQEMHWNAEDSMNIYPIGTPSTDYSKINGPQSFSEAPYASYPGTDMEVWNGYLFVVLEKTTYQSGDYVGGTGATFESVIQVYDIRNGKKEHVASWTPQDLGIGGTDTTASYGIREITVTDDNIFMLFDVCAEGWMHREAWAGGDVTSYGCGLAIFDNPISRGSNITVPERSACQTEVAEGSDRERYGLDMQWRLGARDSIKNSSVFYADGDYLLYIPNTTAGNIHQGTDEGNDITQGVHIVKWNDSARDATEEIKFTHKTMADWMSITYPDEYKGIENWNGANAPQMTGFLKDGDKAYVSMVYTAPEGDAYRQYDELLVLSLKDSMAPQVIGRSVAKKMPTDNLILNRKLTFDGDYVYVGQLHYHHFDGAITPYIYVFNMKNEKNPTLVSTISLRDYMGNTSSRGTEAVTAVGNYLVVQSENRTIFLELSEDRSEVVDSCEAFYAMMWGSNVCGTPNPLVYGNRIFYPSLGGAINHVWEWDENGQHIVDKDENGNWGDATLQGEEFRHLSRIEVIDFSRAVPKGITAEREVKNSDGSYTVYGEVSGMTVNDSILLTDGATDTLLGTLSYEDIDFTASPEEGSGAWSFTTSVTPPETLVAELISGGESVVSDEIALTSKVMGADPTKVSVLVDILNDEPSLNNPFRVYGEYFGEEPTTIQPFAAFYQGNRLLKIKVCPPISLIPGEDFFMEDSLTLPEGTDLTDTSFRVFTWNSAAGMQPLGEIIREEEIVYNTFTYTLSEDATTSAGVYDEEGRLLRTLWSATEEEAGEHTKEWDGKDDNGVLLEDGTYSVKILENNVEIVRDAYIGNTSDHSTYEGIISGFSNFFSDMMYVDGKMFYIYPYSEGRQSFYYFNVDNPDKKVAEFGGTNRCMQRAVTDGERMYMVNTEIGMDHVYRTFLYSFDLQSQSMYYFPQGASYSGWGINDLYWGVNMITHNEGDFQTGGLGVQTEGNFLFASYTTADKVYVVDKNSGATLTETSFESPRALAYNDNGGLWIGYKDGDTYRVGKYDVDASGNLTANASGSTITDTFGLLLHMELSPDGKRIVIADGATNQYHMYSVETGEKIWTFGSGESYADDPTIHDDKLMLSYTSDQKDLVFSEFEDDNTLWIDDPGNNRAFKLDLTSGTPRVVHQIMTQAGSQSLGLNATRPTEVYSGGIQYEMDYSKSGNECWKAVKNWKIQMLPHGISTVWPNAVNNVITLSNGKTYFSADSGGRRLFYFDGNQIVNTGIDFYERVFLPDGRVGSITWKAPNETVYKIHNITGFDGNVPIIDEGVQVAEFSVDWRYPTQIFGAMKHCMPITENGVMLALRCTLQTEVTDQKTWHLGGVKLKEGEVVTDWQWLAAPEGSVKYDGNFPTDGTFEAGNGVLNSAQTVVASGSNVVFQYNGEFYKQGQTNKLYFYRDNGLLVGVFGDACRQVQVNGKGSEYGKEIFPGNAFDMYFVQDETDTDKAYILQNNENGFGNFKYNVTGLDSILEHQTTVNLKKELVSGLSYTYSKNDVTDPADKTQKAIRTSIGNEPYVAGDNFIMCYEGYMENPTENDSFTMFVSSREDVTISLGGSEVYRGAGDGEFTVNLTPGKRISIRVEVKKNASTSGETTEVSLGYLEDGEKKALSFKTEPVEIVEGAVVRDLLEGLPFASSVASGTYGFTLSSENLVDTNAKNPSYDGTRDFRFNANLWPDETGWWPTAATVTKNLGSVEEGMSEWQIDMEVSRSGYLNYGDLGNKDNSVGVHIDVLDENDKVIARFYWAKENNAYGNNTLLYHSDNMYNNALNWEIYAVPNTEENDFLNPQNLTIRSEGDKVSFSYYGETITVPVFDSSADITRPAKVKFDAFYTYNPNQVREMAVYVTDFTYTQYTN